MGISHQFPGAILLLVLFQGVWAQDTERTKEDIIDIDIQEVSVGIDALDTSEEEELAELYGEEEFVSIATGTSKPIYKAPAIASVITAEDIKAYGAKTLHEVLEHVPGLHVAPSALSRLDPVVSIRGIHTGLNPHVLVLLNGLSFPDVNTGSTPVQFRLPVASISRIEVIRGPGSAVYGADAYAGVINIITKDGAEIGGTEIGGRAGSFDTQHAWINHGQQLNNWDLSFSFEWQTTGGDRDRTVNSDLQGVFDGIFSTAASLAPGPLETRYELFDIHAGAKNKNWDLKFWYWETKDAGVGAGGAQALDPIGSDNNHQFLFDAKYHTDELLKHWDLSARTSYRHLDQQAQFHLFPAGSLLPIGADGNVGTAGGGIVLFPNGLIGNPGNEFDDILFELTGEYNGWRDHHLRFSTGVRHQTMNTNETKNFGPGILDGTVTPINGTLTDVTDTAFIYASDTSRTIYFVSAQDEWQFAKDWELTAGIRFDDYSDFGNTVNPRLALVWETRHNLTTKLLYGRAFRAPAFNEQFSINNPVVLGNPSLDPETIDTYELSLNYRPSYDLNTNLSFYYYEAKDLIEFVADTGGTTSTAQNARDQDGIGVEIEAEWKVSKNLKLYTNYAWQHAEDSDTHIRIADAPAQQFHFSTRWQFAPNWSFNPTLYWIADRNRAAGDSRTSVDSYALVNLVLKKTKLIKNLDISLLVNNVFNSNVREPSSSTSNIDDFPMEGRSAWLELSYHFSK